MNYIVILSNISTHCVLQVSPLACVSHSYDTNRIVTAVVDRHGACNSGRG